MSGNISSIISLARNSLDDLSLYLKEIEPALYQESIDILSGSTIGQHTRHILEFYKCLIEQSSQGTNSLIDYGKRRRELRIETDPVYALQSLREISDNLEVLDASQCGMLNCAEQGSEKLMVRTTIGRELMYNLEHTIHHLAIIKIALRLTMPLLVLPEHFGVAPSTLRYRREACAQ